VDNNVVKTPFLPQLINKLFKKRLYCDYTSMHDNVWNIYIEIFYKRILVNLLNLFVSETFRESMVVAKLGHILIHSQYTVNIWWRTFRSPNLITSLYIFTTSHVFWGWVDSAEEVCCDGDGGSVGVGLPHLLSASTLLPAHSNQSLQ
jgi:hypothetical protein